MPFSQGGASQGIAAGLHAACSHCSGLGVLCTPAGVLMLCRCCNLCLCVALSDPHIHVSEPTPRAWYWGSFFLGGGSSLHTRVQCSMLLRCAVQCCAAENATSSIVWMYLMQLRRLAAWAWLAVGHQHLALLVLVSCNRVAVEHFFSTALLQDYVTATTLDHYHAPCAHVDSQHRHVCSYTRHNPQLQYDRDVRV
jgi:hypothetical protein